MHAVAADRGEAAAARPRGRHRRRAAERRRLPRAARRAGARRARADEALVDRAVLRVLAQKEELGLLDETFDAAAAPRSTSTTPEHRTLARRLAEESVVLLTNDGVLPLALARRPPAGSR